MNLRRLLPALTPRQFAAVALVFVFTGLGALALAWALHFRNRRPAPKSPLQIEESLP